MKICLQRKCGKPVFCSSSYGMCVCPIHWDQESWMGEHCTHGWESTHLLYGMHLKLEVLSRARTPCATF